MSKLPTNDSTPDALCTVDEIAQVLRLQPETIRQMARDGRIPAHKVGRVWRFDRREVQEWILRGTA